MKRLIDSNEYASLFKRRTVKFSIGDKVGILMRVVGAYNYSSINSAIITNMDAENRIFVLTTESSEIAIKLNHKDYQVVLGRVTKYETSLIKL